ncbi:hypothetical protein EDD16DRAFT_1516664 [Pisolithus croceorrhizus]|nr:hypothetical protein EDD16DRAFT_1516664 [Pisolithus croceorrhizus]KAI6156131.1 hypothetical protein EDD17DRAFT_1512736 [Pisolithus thermaeus]
MSPYQEFTDEDAATMMQYLTSPPDKQPHTCGWVDSGVVCYQPLLPDEFSNHLRRHGVTGDDKAKMYCRWVHCNTLMNKESVARHVLEVHLGIKFECPVCGYEFSRRDSMMSHRNKFHRT